LFFYVLLGRAIFRGDSGGDQVWCGDMLRTAYKILGGRAGPNAMLRITDGADNVVQDEPGEKEDPDVEGPSRAP
jgi:hypothetical protein